MFILSVVLSLVEAIVIPDVFSQNPRFTSRDYKSSCGGGNGDNVRGLIAKYEGGGSKPRGIRSEDPKRICGPGKVQDCKRKFEDHQKQENPKRSEQNPRRRLPKQSLFE